MESIKSFFVKPDPQAQLRKCNALIRANARKLDREIANLKQLEIKTRKLVLQADKRAAQDLHRQAQAHREMRDFARILIQQRRNAARLVTSKAQLSSVQMQVNEAFAVRRIEGALRGSIGIMRDVNSLTRLPELANTMQELSLELMKAGIIEEMVGESLPEDDAAELEEAAEDEVDQVLGEILKDRLTTTGNISSAPIDPKSTLQEEVVEEEEEEEEKDSDAVMDQMRDRLQALRS